MIPNRAPRPKTQRSRAGSLFFTGLSTHYVEIKCRKSINVGSELGLVLNGTPHFIKLYFTDDGINQKLDNGKAQLMLYLLRKAIHEQIDDGDRLAIINIKNSASIIRDKEIDEFTEKNLILNLKNFIEAWNMV
ncbi:hypothetical protein [Brevibacillus centrosporus]|uniref:hypothetical protein n=1 Tax=Brevibacillus centrosporus TaxID=54910 RepID=UPI00398696DA